MGSEELNGSLLKARTDIDNENVHNTKTNKVSQHETLPEARARLSNNETLNSLVNHQKTQDEITQVTNKDPPLNSFSSLASKISDVNNDEEKIQLTNTELAKLLSMIHKSDESDMSAGQANLDDEDLQFRFPVLYGEGYFKENPSFRYLKLSWLAQEELSAKNRLYNQPRTIQDKLELNNKKVQVLKKWDMDYDDLNTTLHPIRFERAPITPATTLFTMAASRIPHKQG